MELLTEEVKEQTEPLQGNRLWVVLSLILGIIGCATGAIALFISSASPKIAYVQSNELIYNYDGMKEAQQHFQKKQSVWQANLDTLQLDFQRAVNLYNNEFPNLSHQEKQQREAQLRKQEEQLMQYERTLKEKAGDEDQKMSQTLLNQINGYIKEYRDKHNYDVILGTTSEGSVLAGSDRINITQDILQYINTKYHVSGGKITTDSSDQSK